MDKEFFKHNNFDLLRLLAALQVIVVHGYDHFNFEGNSYFIKVLSVFPGVPVFFVISGFLISASLERSSSVSGYFINRFLRIYPALWACFLFSLITIFIFYVPEFSLAEFSSWVVAQVTIAQFYNPGFLRDYGVGVLNGSLWTIPVELQFYLILPVLYFIFNRFKWNNFWFFGFLVLLVVVNQWYMGFRAGGDTFVSKVLGVTVFPYLYMFVFGVLLQRNISFVRRFLAKKSLTFFGVYLIVVSVSYFLGFNYSGNYLNPFQALALSLLTISAAYSRPDIFSDVMRGYDISYGVYIYHMVFVNLLLQVSVFTPVFNFIVMVFGTVFIAIVSWVYIEKPALSLKRYSLRYG